MGFNISSSNADSEILFLVEIMTLCTIIFDKYPGYFCEKSATNISCPLKLFQCLANAQLMLFQDKNDECSKFLKISPKSFDCHVWSAFVY